MISTTGSAVDNNPIHILCKARLWTKLNEKRNKAPSHSTTPQNPTVTDSDWNTSDIDRSPSIARIQSSARFHLKTSEIRSLGVLLFLYRPVHLRVLHFKTPGPERHDSIHSRSLVRAVGGSLFIWTRFLVVRSRFFTQFPFKNSHISRASPKFNSKLP
jgi:hypothetical protein